MGLVSAVGGWVSARTLSGSGGSRGVFPLSPAQRLCSHDLLEKCIRQASRERLSPPAAAGGTQRGVACPGSPGKRLVPPWPHVAHSWPVPSRACSLG